MSHVMNALRRIFLSSFTTRDDEGGAANRADGEKCERGTDRKKHVSTAPGGG